MAKRRIQQPIIDPSLSIKAITKSSVWAIWENDVICMWKEAQIIFDQTMLFTWAIKKKSKRYSQ